MLLPLGKTPPKTNEAVGWRGPKGNTEKEGGGVRRKMKRAAASSTAHEEGPKAA
jgi:hypothetical protein